MATSNTQHSIGEMKHHTAIIITLTLAVVVLGAYVLMQTSLSLPSAKNPGTISDEAMRAQALAKLNATSVTPPSAEQVNKIVTDLSKSKATLSDSEKADVIRQLQNSK